MGAEVDEEDEDDAEEEEERKCLGRGWISFSVSSEDVNWPMPNSTARSNALLAAEDATAGWTHEDKKAIRDKRGFGKREIKPTSLAPPGTFPDSLQRQTRRNEDLSAKCQQTDRERERGPYRERESRCLSPGLAKTPEAQTGASPSHCRKHIDQRKRERRKED